ncbi:MAG: hypothetical protein CML60_09660 [Rhodobacteraceae bacterium]|nr:hypothetical protein [Paracoccaceae bacterium]MBT26646.1 hypothetical protein [Paracoccaceae bacterium]
MPSDDSLTSQGLAPSHKAASVLIIACGALAREILALIERNGWSHMDLTCLPAILHNHPERIADAVERAILDHQSSHRHLFVAYADCGTGGALQKVCERHAVPMIRGPHCYAFFEGVDRFAQHDDEITAFYLTDFLTRQFDAFVWKPLGLDRHPDLRDMYFGHYTKLIYQAQTDDPALTAKAQDCATRLGLQFERRFTGYGDLQTALAAL